MSFVPAIAALTSSFLGATELPPQNNNQIEQWSAINSGALSSVIQAPYSNDNTMTIQLAQSNPEDVIRGILGAIIRDKLEDEGILPERQSAPDLPRSRQAGINRVSDGFVSPDEVQTFDYIGENSRTGINFWDITVRDYGVVCGATQSDSSPQRQTMQIAQYNSCLEPAQRTPLIDRIERDFDERSTAPDQSPRPVQRPRWIEDAYGRDARRIEPDIDRLEATSTFQQIVADGFIAPSELIASQQIGTGPSSIDGQFYYDIYIESGSVICGRNPHDIELEIVGAEYVQPVGCRERYEPNR